MHDHAQMTKQRRAWQIFCKGSVEFRQGVVHWDFAGRTTTASQDHKASMAEREKFKLPVAEQSTPAVS